MKNKFWAAIFAVVAASCVVFGVAACAPDTTDDESPHVHSFSDEWSHDETHHWYAATCEHSQEVSGRAEHFFSWTVEEDATCTEAGLKSGVCICGAETTETIPALDHDYGAWTANGDGTHTHVCKNDASHTETKACEYDDEVIAPTCMEGGYTLHICKLCGDEKQDTPTAELGHEYGADGACSRCGDVNAIVSLDDLLKMYPNEMRTALKENFYSGIMANFNSNIINFREANIYDSHWDFDCDNDGNISTIYFVTFYKSSLNNTRYLIEKITLSSPMLVASLTINNLNGAFAESSRNAKYNQDYSLSFDSTIQETRKALTNAIFEALGVADTGAERIFIREMHDLGDTIMGNGEYKTYNVVEIWDSGVQEYSLKTRWIDYGTDNDYIQQIAKGEYRSNPYGEDKSYQLSGTILNAETATSTVSALVALPPQRKIN